MRKADGTTGVVQAVNVEAHAQVMYNLTVATAHTFFVGLHQWLVHNACPVLYRVEGIPNQRFSVDALGNVSMVAGPEVGMGNRLYIGFDPDHALYYLSLKVQTGLPGSHITYFEVDQEFLDLLRHDAVAQKFGKLYPNLPQLSDINQGHDLYGVPSNYFDQLMKLIIQGTGGMLYP